MNECEKTEDDADILNLEAEFDAAAGAASPGIAVCALLADIANLSLSVGASVEVAHMYMVLCACVVGNIDNCLRNQTLCFALAPP